MATTSTIERGMQESKEDTSSPEIKPKNGNEIKPKRMGTKSNPRMGMKEERSRVGIVCRFRFCLPPRREAQSNVDHIAKFIRTRGAWISHSRNTISTPGYMHHTMSKLLHSPESIPLAKTFSTRHTPAKKVCSNHMPHKRQGKNSVTTAVAPAYTVNSSSLAAVLVVY